MIRDGMQRWLWMILSHRFIKFGVVGCSGTLVNLGLLYLGQEYLFFGIQTPSIRLNVSLALAISVATLNNFAWNRLWTWQDRQTRQLKSLSWQLLQYTIAAGLAISLQILFTHILAVFMHYLFANLVAILLAAGVNYWANNIWTFAQQQRRGLIAVNGEFRRQ